MNSFRTAALRRIFPLAARDATDDFLGMDRVVFPDAEDLETFAELFFDFDDACVVEDREDRDEEE